MLEFLPPVQSYLVQNDTLRPDVGNITTSINIRAPVHGCGRNMTKSFRALVIYKIIVES